MIQETLHCAVVRGGTSKGLLIQSGELPSERHDEAILSIFGSYDSRQIDGLGGATSTTSKLMIVGASPRPNIDIEYTFGQVGVTEPLIDYGGNCGNMTTAVGPFAYDEGMVTPTPDENGRVTVSLYNTNTDTRIKQSFPVDGQRTITNGEFAIHGVHGTGARVDTTFLDPGNSSTGALFPLGKPIVPFDTPFGTVETTVLDVTTPVAFVRAADLNLTGAERPADIDNDDTLLERIEHVRALVCAELNIVDNPSKATEKSPGFPKLAFVAEPQTYKTDTSVVNETDIDITARIMSMQYLHPIYAVTGAACTAAASLLPGTVPNQVANSTSNEVTLGHPQGKMKVTADVTTELVRSVTISRTQRRLMEGDVFYTLE
jgi:2-methylaconitate cis-trans-isomerase PrpF